MSETKREDEPEPKDQSTNQNPIKTQKEKEMNKRFTTLMASAVIFAAVVGTQAVQNSNVQAHVLPNPRVFMGPQPIGTQAHVLPNPRVSFS
jgi:hypothetical protein